ncbi:hypothetical protein BVC80_1719g33 [Macleaya cordata]|uniref:Uncharacterized protein n=1 Tax=Macleaya cordata TaxID=56857 RepID=A0A200Q2L2_MACCD|nr:hypothetical protein BVC80_1719g33 [Macleaya cordata]
MKGSGTLIASIMAASTVVCTSSGDWDVSAYPCSNKGSSSSAKDGESNKNSSGRSSDKDKFEPRFDGLRFIETLVTAHR